MKTPESSAASAASADDGAEGERIAKRLARAGLCSRRDAERWIEAGRVVVNGQTLTSPAVVVKPGDTIVVDGKPLAEPEPARLWRYHKPAGLVTTARDEKGRATVFDKLPPELPRVVSVGRLDLTTEGLLLLTNDGELARFLELPATGWTRRYRVRVHGTVDEARLATLIKGPIIDGVKYGPVEAELDRVQGTNAWLSVGLKEGKNREIRKVMESMGLQVTRLIRVAYGPFQLGKLEEGAVEEVPRRVVKDQLARFFADSEGETPKANTGTAKAKPPKPAVRPADARPTPGKPAGAKPGGAKPAGAKPAAARTDGDKPASARPEIARPSRARPLSVKPADERTAEAKPARSARSTGARSTGAPSTGAPSTGAPSTGDRTTGNRTTGAKPPGSRSADARSADARPSEGKPAAARAARTAGNLTSAKPAAGKSAVGKSAAGKSAAGKSLSGKAPGPKPSGPGKPAGAKPRADRRR